MIKLQSLVFIKYMLDLRMHLPNPSTMGIMWEKVNF